MPVFRSSNVFPTNPEPVPTAPSTPIPPPPPTPTPTTTTQQPNLYELACKAEWDKRIRGQN